MDTLKFHSICIYLFENDEWKRSFNKRRNCKNLLIEELNNDETRGQSYKTFYDCNLQIFVLS